jgi:phage terminase large subunit-like protein
MTAVLDALVPTVGSTAPRVFTPPLFEQSLGSDAVTFSEEVCGIELMPWQCWLFDAALELRAPWTDVTAPPPFRYRTVVVLVARQNGKTCVLQLRALAGMFLWRERLAVSMAQTRSIAFEPWREGALLVRDVQALANEVRSVRTSNGSEAIELRNGARWVVVAANDGGRGLSSDLVLMDEVRQQHTGHAWSAVEKSRSAKPHGQLWAFSNAGDDNSVVLNNLVARGREVAADPERDPTLGFFEWSAHDDCDPSDVREWQLANPALGYTIPVSTVRAELAQDAPTDFLTERLCVRVKHLGSWLPPGLWDSLHSERARIDSSAVTFAVDAAPDLMHAVIVAASQLRDGSTAITVYAELDALPGRPVAAMVADTVQSVLHAYPHAQVLYDARGPIAATMGDLAAAGLACAAMDATDVQRACERFYELCVSRNVVHDGNQLLADHVSNAAPNTYQDAWKFARRHAAGPVNALIAAVLAVASARAPRPATPAWTAY